VLSDIVVANSALPGTIVPTPCGDDEIFIMPYLDHILSYMHIYRD
jgi:hypothetical protein